MANNKLYGFFEEARSCINIFSAVGMIFVFLLFAVEMPVVALCLVFAAVIMFIRKMWKKWISKPNADEEQTG